MANGLTTNSPGLSGQFVPWRNSKLMKNKTKTAFPSLLPKSYSKGTSNVRGGAIQPLKKSTKGTFTASAKKAGSSVQGFASRVLGAPRGQYSPLQRKRANFARNAAEWHH